MSHSLRFDNNSIHTKHIAGVFLDFFMGFLLMLLRDFYIHVFIKFSKDLLNPTQGQP